ncbi:LIM/homeobox protein Awh like protein [Argiope bruennichi]|uniref:LIM/homeobox protein Awh like protein n=1 Tax=Argiope bruennichi TaxID=94029 RepID=A0A8T0F3I5_ARGBR|nr:LIM/homeobox protein Awh like protein [Argiope bruennichi]
MLSGSSLSEDDQVAVTIMKTEQEICYACGQLIRDRYLLHVNGRSWHACCLRCSVCQAALDKQPSCFIKDDNVYCRTDYVRHLEVLMELDEEEKYSEKIGAEQEKKDEVDAIQRLFGAKCAKCSRTIHASDWVRRARDQVYHLACFACDSCKRQLSTGEEFALHDSRVLCKTHFYECMDGGNGSNDENTDQDHQQKAKTKRVRTTFTEEQLQVLQANFNLDSNPDGQDLERIAQITGLSKRVTQVWFQNSRARQKKYLNNQAKKANAISMPSMTAATSCPGCGMLYCLCSHPSLQLNMSQVA